MADYVVIMYAGRVVEKGTAREIFNTPSHPYTIGLMRSKPVVGKKVDKLYSIPGKVPIRSTCRITVISATDVSCGVKNARALIRE